MENIAIHAATAGEGEGRGRAGDKFRRTTLFLRSSSACYSTLPSCTRIVLIGSYREFNSPLLPRCSSTGRIESGRDHRARSFSPRLSLFASLLFNFLPRVSCTTFERRLLIGLLLSVQKEERRCFWEKFKWKEERESYLEPFFGLDNPDFPPRLERGVE